MTTLIRTKDRKVANLVTPNGKQASIANTFGLPAGKAFSCPGATDFCSKICYAGKLEKIFKGAKDILMHNWELVKDAPETRIFDLLDEMLTAFESECDRRGARKLFRIHWDGDFFSTGYTDAWHAAIMAHPDIQFWVYTRVAEAVTILRNLDNLSLYFSADPDNIELAKELQSVFGVRIAYVDKSFAIAKDNGVKGIRCPENNKKVALITANGSACVSCGQCVFARNDILFSTSKK
jgi:hypothetical protein